MQGSSLQQEIYLYDFFSLHLWNISQLFIKLQFHYSLFPRDRKNALYFFGKINKHPELVKISITKVSTVKVTFILFVITSY